MQLTINQKTFMMLKAIANLAKDNKDINPYSISRIANVDWKTAKKFYKNNLNIKELKCQ